MTKGHHKELLHNIVRHAEASVIDVGITLKLGQFSLFVEDDGKGFDIRQQFEGRGLQSLKRRAEQLGGNLRILSELGKGTRIEFETKLDRCTAGKL